MKHLLGISLLILFISCADDQASCEADVSPSPQTLFTALPSSPIAIAYDEFFQDKFSTSKVPGAALTLVKDGEVLLQKGYGVKANGSSEKVNSKTVFRLGSVSKTFAALLAGMVVEHSALNWDSAIADYLDYFAVTPLEQSNKITLAHILSHTSGMPPHSFTNLVETGMPIKDIIPYLPEVEHVKKEGENFAYQNLMFALVEPVLEKVTGQAYSHLLEKHILSPAGMETASTSYEAIKNNANVASPHSKVKKGFRKIKISEKYYNAVSAGGMNASIEDMSAYLKILLGDNSEIAEQKLLDQLFEPRIETNFERRYFDKWKETESAHYGLGWRVIYFKNKKLIYHGGFVNGFRSEIFIDPVEKIGGCLLLNASDNLANNFIPDFYKFYNTYLCSIEPDVMTMAP